MNRNALLLFILLAPGRASSLEDCDGNGRPDAADIASGESRDCDADGLPDACEPDCNANGAADDCDLAAGSSMDSNGDAIPDECEAFSGDCDRNGIDDALDRAQGAGDCDGDGVLDACEVRPEIILSADDTNRAGLRSVPRTAAAADLDGDGDLDAAFGGGTGCCDVESGSGSIEIVLGNADGRLASIGLHRLCGTPLQIVPGDVDGDGDIDLVSLYRSSPCPDGRAVTLHLNRGSGALDPGAEAQLLPGSDSLAVGDLDGDLRLEVLASNPLLVEEGCAVLLEQQGAGLARSTVGPAGGSTAVAVGDWTSDGVLDIAAASVEGPSFYLFPGAGGGALGPERHYFQAFRGASKLIPWDFDHDGLLDLLWRDPEGPLYFLALTGPAEFADVHHSFAPSGAFLLPADIDGDAREELVSVWHGDDDASLIQVLRLASDSLESLPGWNGLPAYITAGAVVPLAGDWDRDGLVDLLVAEVRSRSAAILRNGGGALRFFTTTSFSAGSEALELEAADLDGDGDPDLARVDGQRQELAIARQENGSFSERIISLPGRVPSVLASGDVNLDGSVDLIAAAPFEVIVIAQSEGGSVSTPRSHPVGSDPYDLVPGDLDGDGDLDLATVNRVSEGVAENVSVFRNPGDGQYETARNYRSPLQGTGLVLADLDLDGDRDPVVTGRGIFLLRNDGRGGLGAPEPLFEADRTSSPLAGDMDGDGDEDLIAVMRDIALFRNGGEGTLLAPEPIGTTGRQVLELVDIDRDADLDIVALEGYGAHWLQVHRNRAGGLFDTPLVHDAGQAFPPLAGSGGGASGSSPGASAIAPADFDEDGDPDLALGFAARSWITIVWNRTEVAEVDLDGDAVPDSCRSAAFRRGDADLSGALELTDASRVLRWLFFSSETLPCEEAGDANDDGLIDITDAVGILNHLFLGDGPPGAPYPDCGPDPTADGLSCGAGCV